MLVDFTSLILVSKPWFEVYNILGIWYFPMHVRAHTHTHTTNSGSSENLTCINTEVKKKIVTGKIFQVSSAWSVQFKASGFLLSVVCDGFPQFTQDSASVRTQTVTVTALYRPLKYRAVIGGDMSIGCYSDNN